MAIVTLLCNTLQCIDLKLSLNCRNRQILNAELYDCLCNLMSFKICITFFFIYIQKKISIMFVYAPKAVFYALKLVGSKTLTCIA